MTDWEAKLVAMYGGDAIQWTDAAAVIVDDTETPVCVARVHEELPVPSITEEMTAVQTKCRDIDAAHGAILTDSVEYVFTPASNTDFTYEVTHPGLPLTQRFGGPPREFASVDELLWCFQRALRLVRPPGAATVEERKTALLNVLTAFRAVLTRCDSSDPFGDAVAGILNGYDFEATDPRIKQAFIRRIATADSLLRYSTRGEIADFMVRLAGITGNDTVVDPTAGLGVVLRAAADSTASLSGVEIDGEIADAARFFNDLLDSPIDVTTADFTAEGPPVPSEDIDHILIEPPTTRYGTDGSPVGSLVTREGRHIEETLLRAAAEYLPPDGTLTAFLPFATLDRPDSPARSLRDYLREEFRITALIDLTNQGYYPYPGVRTAVLQLQPDTSQDYDIPVAVIEAAAPAARFDSPGDNDIEPLLEETLAAITEGRAETIPIDAFGETLDPGTILRHRDMETTVAAEYPNPARLDEIANVERGAAIPWRDLGAGGVRFLNVAAVTGHADAKGYVPPDDADIVATGSDVLLSMTGTIGRIHRPTAPVAPGADWAILRFDSPETALVYEGFFHTTIGTELLALLQRDAIAPYPRYTPRLPLRRLRRVPVPAFEPDTISTIASALRATPDPSTTEYDTVFTANGRG